MKPFLPLKFAKLGWLKLQNMLGEDAYARYLAHWRDCHGGEGEPLTRAAFFKSEISRKWNGPRRCC